MNIEQAIFCNTLWHLNTSKKKIMITKYSLGKQQKYQYPLCLSLRLLKCWRWSYSTPSDFPGVSRFVRNASGLVLTSPQKKVDSFAELAPVWRWTCSRMIIEMGGLSGSILPDLGVWEVGKGDLLLSYSHRDLVHVKCNWNSEAFWAFTW